jgi:lysophospholipase L1-like esterase
MDTRIGTWSSVALCLILAACGGGGGGGGTTMPPPVVLATFATWSASPQALNDAPAGVTRPAPALFSDQTVRQVAHLSAGGSKLRVKLSNLFGSGPVTFTAVRIAKSAGGSSIDASTDRAVTFGGAASLTAPAGSELWSDDVDLFAARGADVAVSIYIAAQASAETGHIGANSTVYLAHGNVANAPSLAGADIRTSFYWLSEIAASAEQKPSVVVAFGDSITEGSQSTPDRNLRYPDQLSARLAGETTPAISVVNAGIGGNRWVFDFPGPSGASRFERDVLGVQGVTHAILLLGINDLEVAHTIPSQPVTVDQLIAATQTAVSKAKPRGVKVFLGTLLPYKGSALYDLADEAVREAYNAWIRTQTVADGVIDFEAALRDPSDPLAIAPQFASPDHLHPNDAGYAAMAAAVDITRLR